MRGFDDVLNMVYDSPERVSVEQAKELLYVAENGMLKQDCCAVVDRGGCIGDWWVDTADIRGNAWLALALVQNLSSIGYRFGELPGMECCAKNAMEWGYYREATDLLHEAMLDLEWCDYCLFCCRHPHLHPRDVALQDAQGITRGTLTGPTRIARTRLRLERLLATGDFYEAADLLAELDCDAIPEKWAPSNHLEWPKRVRERVWIWLLVATRLGLCKDIRILVCTLITC